MSLFPKKVECSFKLKEFQLWHVVPLIKVSFRTVDQSEDPGRRVSIASFSIQKQISMATVLFDGNMVEEAFRADLVLKPVRSILCF